MLNAVSRANRAFCVEQDGAKSLLQDSLAIQTNTSIRDLYACACCANLSSENIQCKRESALVPKFNACV